MRHFIIQNRNIKRSTSSKELKLFIWICLIIIALGLGIFLILNHYAQTIYDRQMNGIDQLHEGLLTNYQKKLSDSKDDAQVTLFKGISLINKKQIELGLITLEEAVKKDEKWRDSALYTGYTYLRLAQEFSNSNLQFSNESQIQNLKSQTNDYLLKAKNYLEKARGIDPFYLKTQEYLVTVYKELNDQANLDLTNQRIADFSQRQF